MGGGEVSCIEEVWEEGDVGLVEGVGDNFALVEEGIEDLALITR